MGILLNKLKPKSEFSRNVLTLMTGTTIAQAIPIAISPILTRIYTPEDFGFFALYIGIAIILSVFVSGRYELAIILPEKDEDAFHLMILSFVLTTIISLCILIIILFFSMDIAKFLGNMNIEYWLYFIPLTLFLTGIYQNLIYWSNRKKYYKRLAFNKVIQSATGASGNILLGLNNIGGGLIFSNIFGQGIATFILGKKVFKNDNLNRRDIELTKLLLIARKYIDFPKYSIPSDLFTVLNAQLVIFFMAKYFSLASVGFFSFVLRIVAIPSSVISSSIGDVFRQEASVQYIKNRECSIVYLDTLKKLFFLSLVPFVVFAIYSPVLFGFIFGEKWIIAGEYAQLLTPMFFFQFISSPLSAMFYIANKQALYLKLTVVTLLMMIGLLILVDMYQLEIKILLIGYGVIYSTLYLVNIAITLHLSKKRIR